MKHVFENAIAPSKVPVVFLGKEASKFKRYMAPLTWSFELSHPASASYKNTDWNTDKTFSKLNRMMLDDRQEYINWLNQNPPF